jgi:hypothetical protein
MKTHSIQGDSRLGPCHPVPAQWEEARGEQQSRRDSQAGFTITEMMIAAGLFSLVIVGSILSHVTGLKLCAITQTKLRATHTARAALNRTREDIRSATLIEVGNYVGTNFSYISSTNPRQGNAIQIHPTSNTNIWIRYYVDASDQTLKRIANNPAGLETIANYITNKIPFAAEDYAGHILTNDQNNRVVRMTLEFYQWEFASLNRGGSNSFDYYRVQTRIARRAL